MKHALIAATLLTVGGLAVGCGGNDSADSASGSASDNPSSASSSASGSASGSAAPELCTALSSGASIQDGQDVANFVDTLKKAGTPADAPAAAKKGFDVYVGVLDKIDPKASAKDLKKMGQVKLSSTQKTEVQQFLGYASQTCAPSAPSGGSTAGGSASGGASGGASSN